ncbi:MAG: cupin domain-containing protein [Deltaproteobacteria bacterium]|nr:cupin domain-containing protein [Deltaproteobacteria bacterium]
MAQSYEGGVVFTPAEESASEYLPNHGVFLTGLLGKSRGDAYGLYRGTIAPSCGIALELHEHTSETVMVISGQAVGLIGDREIPMGPGQVMHVDKNVWHGIRNSGSESLEILVIGHPDF